MLHLLLELRRYKKSDLKLIELDENLDNEEIKTFAKPLAKTKDPIYLGNEVKKVIKQVYFFEEQNPKVDFKIQKI